MAVRNSTPRKRRSLSSPKPQHSFVQRIAREVIEIERCLQDLRQYFKRLQQAANASKRLGNKVYWQIREEEKRGRR